MFVVFFFKQKTAYEVRISDWSSDGCSSDLGVALDRGSSRGRAHGRISDGRAGRLSARVHATLPRPARHGGGDHHRRPLSRTAAGGSEPARTRPSTPPPGPHAASPVVLHGLASGPGLGLRPSPAAVPGVAPACVGLRSRRWRPDCGALARSLLARDARQITDAYDTKGD